MIWLGWAGLQVWRELFRHLVEVIRNVDFAGERAEEVLGAWAIEPGYLLWTCPPHASRIRWLDNEDHE